MLIDKLNLIRPRVLVADPDQAMRETIVDMLIDRGVDAVGVASGDEAVEALATRPIFKAVITELSFPTGQTRGTDLPKIMRELNVYIPILLFTRDVPPCIRPIDGVSVYDKLDADGRRRFIARIGELAA